MTPARISAVIVAERIAWVAEVSRVELFEICTQRLGDIEGALASIRAWLAAHPELVDQSL